MIHDLITTADGKLFRHVCKLCGEKHTTKTERWVGACKGPPCIHLGKVTGEFVKCNGCNGEIKLKIYGCDVHGTCLPTTRKDKETAPSVNKCDGCNDRR